MIIRLICVAAGLALTAPHFKIVDGVLHTVLGALEAYF